MEALAGFGIPEPEIAKVLEIDPERLRELFAKELDGGRTRANAKDAENLFRKAIGDGRESVTAAISTSMVEPTMKKASPRSQRQTRTPC